LAGGKKKIGPSGNEQKTNITDPDSAKMTTSHGVLQGYNGLAVVDDKHQIVVCAEAHGSGQEAHLLMPMVQSTRKNFRTIGRKTDIFKKTKLTADSGFHSGKSMEEIEGSKVDAYIADPQYRKREEAFANQGRYKERHNEEDRLASRKKRKDERKQFGLEDFLYDAKRHTCICPAGKSLYRTGRDMVISGYRVARYKAPLSACRPCPLRAKCLRHPENLDAQRQVQFVKQRLAKGDEDDTAAKRMQSKFDSRAGRAIYSKRMATAEPVFGNAHNKGMDYFTLRGQRKVDAQWKLFNIVLNIEKIAHYGKAA